MITQNYNPDVLTCLANLSNDEVFTPPAVVNKMLDLLPTKLWSNPDAKFLDPVSKTGVFLREIAKRLMAGLEEQIPDVQERANHIFGTQLYGLAITELTALMSRRSVYCSKFANGEYSICTAFDDEQGNIRYEPTAHSWQGGRCIYCGASQEVYDRGEALESHAYRFIHTDNPKKLFPDMKFDVIIGNPPYQLNDGGGAGDAATPIYNQFIEQAIKLSPNYLIMIVPSRWMKGGRGLQKFRETMMSDTRIKVLYDFEDAKECFTGLHIDGGVCYFLWDKFYNGAVEYHFHSLDKTVSVSERLLKTNLSNTVIRDARQLSIIEKVRTNCNKQFSEIVSTQKPFGIRADFFNSPERYSIERFEAPTPNSAKIYGVKGVKGGARRVSTYIPIADIEQGVEYLNNYKLFFSKAYMTTSTVPPEIIVASPFEICTETFLIIGNYADKKDAINCLSYIKTKFFRALLFFNRHSLNISRESFELIPMQDFNEPWTDEKLYAKYGLTEDEIAFIESMIRPME